ncbi:MAG: DUF554 domain-containing protein [Oscillospiraceae bacterium]|nr:DUF554 domain-containing protein [Oscillospiraceae bacterium]
MLGTVVNAGGIIVGSLLGALLKKRINVSSMETVNKLMGITILIFGFNGIISSMFHVEADGTLVSQGGLLLLASVVAGTFLGSALRLEERLAGLGGWVERKFHFQGFAKGFVSSSILYCTGAMAIIGAINDSLRGDPSTLVAKAIMDATISVVAAAAMGISVAFSAVSVFIYQGSIFLFAGMLEPYISAAMLNDISMVGYALLLCIGFNFACGSKIKTADTLPSLLVPVLFNMLLMWKK